MADLPDKPFVPAGGGAFLSTRWSVVISAREDSSAALDHLCRTYWPAIFAFSRRSGDGIEEAQDLTQGFFEQLLSRRWLDQVDAAKGRFRSFLLTAFTRFSRDEWRKTQRQKRGGGVAFFSLDELNAEELADGGLQDSRTPDIAYEKRWVEALITAVMTRLRAEYAAAGKEELFGVLKAFLTSPRGETPYAAAALATGMSEAGLKSAIFRMRQRYGELFREEVSSTCVAPEEVEDEIRHLLSIMGRH